MTEPPAGVAPAGSGPDDSGVRIGNAERQAAAAALDEHLAAGRLDADEYGHRYTAAVAARTRGELAPLFADLPEPRPAPGDEAAPHVKPARPAIHAPHDRHEPLGGAIGRTVVAVMPFVAIGLFFGLRAAGVGAAWLVFLLVPISGAIVYGDKRGRR